MDLRIRILGWVHVLLGGVGLAFGSLLCANILLSPDYRDSKGVAFILPLFAMLAAVWFLPAFIGGWGLLAGKKWAKLLIGALAAVQLVLFPIGTVLAGFSIWALYSLHIEEQRRRVVQPPTELSPEQRAAFDRYTGLGLAAAAAVAIFGLIVAVGYLFRKQIEGFHPPNRFIVGIALSLIVAVFVVFSARGGRLPALSPAALERRRQGEARQKTVVAQHEARLALLLADPQRAKYVPLIRKGDYWSDEQIDYDLDRSRTLTCEHLVPIERAMRAAGIVVKPMMALHVSANCRVNADAMFAELKPASTIDYEDEIFQGGERSMEDFASAIIKCKTCRSAIHTLHARDERPATPWFPRRR